MLSGGSLPIPQEIGRYQIEHLAGEGGMGQVFAAHDPLVKRRVAIKLLKASLVRDEVVRRRFEQEAEAIAALEHPAIVPLYDFGDHEGQLYFVMRWTGGGTLRDRIKRGPLSLRQVTDVLERMAQALDAAHDRGLVHRDIKPANILFDDHSIPFLSDFGVAKIASQQERDTILLGTPQYMSPEQAQGRECDRRSDVYALGVVAFHALSGSPPFSAKTAMAMAAAHVMTPAPSIRSLLPNLPKITDAVFAKVLAKHPSDRYPTAGAFARDLADIAAGRFYLVALDTTPLVERAQPAWTTAASHSLPRTPQRLQRDETVEETQVRSYPARLPRARKS